MNQIKKTFLKKKNDQADSRSAWLKPASQMKSVLVVSNSESKSTKRKAEESFPNASVYHLFPREIKEDRTVGFYYSVHQSDFNLTAKLKNDKLSNLLKMKLDLLVDLSTDSELLDYFVSNSNCHLKIGNMNSEKAAHYDLLFKYEGEEEKNIDNIIRQLNILTQQTDE